MDNTLKYLDEAVQNELNVSELYKMFYEYYPEDYNFWWTLSIEEQKHASLLNSGKEFHKIGDVDFEMSESDIKVLFELNKGFQTIVEDFQTNPSRRYAFDIALGIENTVMERHYESFMTTHKKNDQISKILQKLNHDDVDHMNRIKQYMSENNI
jgi:hypothetical protein